MSQIDGTSAIDAQFQHSLVREELHFRRIDMRGFRRNDGLFEVEGRVTDRKPCDFTFAGGGKTVPANEPIHNMGVRLVFDESLLVVEVNTFTESAPYAPCPEGGQALQSLVGLRMTGGWNKEVRNRISGSRSCTHLAELLGPMATTAFQSFSGLNVNRPDRLDAKGQPVQINSCYAYAAEREVVRKRWPQFYRPA